MFLPRLLLITDRRIMRPSFEAALEAALHGGARLVQLREKDLPPREILNLARRAQRLCETHVCETHEARLLINSRADIARAVSCGVHLPENDLPPHLARLSLADQALCGVSVHSAEAAQRAAQEGADYLVFGPVFETGSHPGAAAAGLEVLREVAGTVQVPVFAVGGIQADNAAPCREAGAHGVALISAVWRAADVSAAVRELLGKL